MSAWDAYITNMKKSGLQICGIFGKEGGAWAQSPEMKASQQEIVAIVSGMDGGGFPNGIYINGMKYTVIRQDKESKVVTAKCKGAPKDDENYLLHVAMANTCLVAGGICGPSERDATKVVEDIRDYLVKSNY